MAPTVYLRNAKKSDIPLILELIRELALYEKEPDAVLATEETLSATLGFLPEGSHAYARVILAFTPEGMPAGMALYFNNYSTWRAKPGIYLEDLFVRPEFRGRGYGTALLARLAAQVKKINGARLEWSVLKWNEPSIKFYESIGAQNLGREWQVMRVDGIGLDELANRGPDASWEDGETVCT
ncbi:acyl-CoA N-acyltransferase [Geopyxis carbonaria]|nr:acyl-CoA N-acyltransferase [Geopyxis carbonaria]